jgi:pimeloyl-ACP methyl ester carboxylesterase
MLAYLDEGDGLPVLALAGLTRDSRDFDYLARRLPQGVRLIRMDSRGRGNSQWTGAGTYTVAQEAQDVISLLDHLQLERVAILGSSRGGLVGMVLAATQKNRLLGLCLNDVGPVLEKEGLRRIAAYVGIDPSVSSLEEIADRMPLVMPGFSRVPDLRWVEETIRHYVQYEDHVGLPYDPEIKIALEAAMAAPPVDAWPLFDACEGLPLAPGENSDVLSQSTADEMRCRRPDMSFANVTNRGHVPFLDEPQSLQCISQWTQCINEFIGVRH